MATYFFSRLSILMEPDYYRKMEYLYNTLIKDVAIVYRKDNYKAINLEIRKVGAKNYLTGKVIKYVSEHSEKTLTEKNEYEDVVLKNLVIAEVRFIYDANESLLIYEENRSHIPKESIPKRFLEILSANAVSDGGLLPVEINPITESYTFFQQIQEIREVKKISIKLHPSNPNSRDIWDRFDKKLKESSVTDYKEVLENKKPGESVKLDEDTRAKIMMGEDGYGKADAFGYDSNGKQVSISTANTDKQAKANILTQDNIEQEIEDLQGKISEIKNKQDANSQ